MSENIVECHSSHTYAEQPTAIVWNNKRLEVTLIQSERHLQGEKQFVVHTSDHLIFELTYSILEDSWHISPR